MVEKCFKQELEKRSDTVECIRFFCALMVLISHAYYLTGSGIDPMARLTNRNFDFGKLAVYAFFFLSGLYVSKSLCKDHKKYFNKRFNRLWPQLFIVIILSIFVLGPIFTDLSFKRYFLSKETYYYLSNVLFILNYNLPEVFTNHPYGPAVNGSLWTLPIEIILYILLWAAYQLGFLKNRKIFNISMCVVWVIWFIGYGVIANFVPEYMDHMELCMLFALGTAVFMNRDSIRLNLKWLLISLIVTAISMVCGINILVTVALPVLVIEIGFYFSNRGDLFSRIGRYSYEIYLIAWPIQQILIEFGIMRPLINSIITILLCIPFAWGISAVTTRWINIRRFKNSENR